MSEAEVSAPTFADLLEALDPKEQRFAEEYLECFNAALAARRVWPRAKAAKQKGYGLTQRPDVAAAIAAGVRELTARAEVTADRIIGELALVAFADPADLVDRKGTPLPLHKLAPEIRRAIASIDVEHERTTTEDVVTGQDGKNVVTGKQRVTTASRVVKYRLVAKTPALELLGKRLKMFSDRLELDATDKLSSLVIAAFNRPAAPAAS